MSSTDQIAYKEASEMIESIAEFAAIYSKKETPKYYDRVLIQDPFDRLLQLRKVPKKAKEPLDRLISQFEESLKRILDTDLVSRETVIQNYRAIIEREVRVLETTTDFRKATFVAPKSAEHSLSPYHVQNTSITVSDCKESDTFGGDDTNRAPVPLKKRTPISKESRELLEQIFEMKKTPNSKERKIIADKCGLTPLQVRVWFTNKRMRSKC